MSQVTVTAKAGPGLTVTAQVITDVISFNFDTVNELLTVTTLKGINNYDITAVTTITLTVSGSNYTLTLT